VCWQGDFYATGFPALATQPQAICGPAASGNTFCDHFQLKTDVSGSVEVVVTWPSPNCVVPAGSMLGGVTVTTCSNGDPGSSDFDLLVCLADLTDTVATDSCGLGYDTVAQSFAFAPGFDSVTFPATAGVTYEVRVLPTDVTFTDYVGCADYVQTGACPKSPGGTGQGTGPSTTCNTEFGSSVGQDRAITGGGNIDVGGNQQFVSMGQRKTKNAASPELKGKVRFKDQSSGTQLWSETVDCITFNDEGADSNGHPNGSAEIRGTGKLKSGPKAKDIQVCYRAVSRDRGEPGGTDQGGADQFRIDYVLPSSTQDGQQVCNFTSIAPGDMTASPFNHGNVDYHAKADAM
jgi:hypothetical protein